MTPTYALVLGATLVVLGVLMESLQHAGVFTSVESAGLEGCLRVGQDSLFAGIEDLEVVHGHGVVLGSSDPRHTYLTLHQRGLAAEARIAQAEQGNLLIYRGNGSKLEKIHVSNMDSVRDFHPHGISVLGNAKRLFVVNHGRSGDTIEILKPSSSTSLAKMRHVQTLRHDLFVGLNDVLALSESSFLVTQFHAHDPLTVRGQMEVLLRQELTYVLHCTFAPKDKEPECFKALEGLAGANGVARQGDTVLVAEAVGHNVHLCTLAADGHLSVRETIPTREYCDNIDVDAESGRVLVGCHPNGLKFAAHAGRPRDVRAPSVVMELSGEMYTMPLGDLGPQCSNSMRTMISDPAGTLLSAASVAAVFQGRVVMGAVFDSGLLDCPLPELPSTFGAGPCDQPLLRN